LVCKAAPAASDEVRPLAPATIERIAAVIRPRDATVVRLLAYAGLRPQEMTALRWGHVGDRTLTVHAPKTRRHRTQPRSVHLLARLAQDLRERRLASRRPDDDAPVIRAEKVASGGTGEWTEPGYEQWINHVWSPALATAGIAYQRPYDLRHSFASLLLHEGRSVVDVARQLGHPTAVCLRPYGHVIEELEDAPRISAEQAILAVRSEEKFGRPE
jgi:integrase